MEARWQDENGSLQWLLEVCWALATAMLPRLGDVAFIIAMLIHHSGLSCSLYDVLLVIQITICTSPGHADNPKPSTGLPRMIAGGSGPSSSSDLPLPLFLTISSWRYPIFSGAQIRGAAFSTQKPLSGVLAALTSAFVSGLSTSSTLTSSLTFMIMPAKSGLTGWKTVWVRRRRPRAARTPRVRVGRPMADRWRVMRKKDMAALLAGRRDGGGIR